MHANICVQILALQPVVCKSLHATICMQPLCANACMPTMVCKSSHATHGVQTFACKPLRASPVAPERRQAGSLHSLPTPSLLSEPQSRVTHPWKPPPLHPVHPSARRGCQRGPAALPGHAAGGVLSVTVTPPAGTSPLSAPKIKGKHHRDQTRPGAWAQGAEARQLCSCRLHTGAPRDTGGDAAPGALPQPASLGGCAYLHPRHRQPENDFCI